MTSFLLSKTRTLTLEEEEAEQAERRRARNMATQQLDTIESNSDRSSEGSIEGVNILPSYPKDQLSSALLEKHWNDARTNLEHAETLLEPR